MKIVEKYGVEFGSYLLELCFFFSDWIFLSKSDNIN